MIVLQTNIADALKDVNTTPALYLQAIGDSSITISDVSFLDGEAVTNKINGATRLLHYSRSVDGYKPATISDDEGTFRFDKLGGLDAWRASVTQEVIFGTNATIDMDITVYNEVGGHVGINIAQNDGAWTNNNNYGDNNLTLVGYDMWTNLGKVWGVDYYDDNRSETHPYTECGEALSSIHLNIQTTLIEGGFVKSVLTITSGEKTLMTLEKTSVNIHDGQTFRMHFLSDKIDYEVSNLTVVGK